MGAKCKKLSKAFKRINNGEKYKYRYYGNNKKILLVEIKGECNYKMESNIAKRIDKIILIALVIFMLIPSEISIFNISVLKIETILISIIIVYLFFMKRESVKEAIKNKFIICNFVFASSIALSIIVNYESILFNDLYEIVKYILYPMITLIVIVTCYNNENYKFILKTITISMIVICTFGIIQYFNPFSINELYIKQLAPTQYETLINNYPTPRIVGIKTNPATYGLSIAVGIYFNVICYSCTKKKLLPIISAVLCLVNLMMTLTRTIQIAFIVSSVIYMAITILQRKGWKKSIIYTAIMISLLILLILILPEELTWRLKQVMDFQNASSWIGRIEKWNDYVEIIKQNLLFGIGPVKNHVDKLGYIDSELIQNFLQYGMIGFGAYIVMILSPLYVLGKKKNKYMVKSFIPLLIMILINNISSSSLILFDTACAIYMFVGMILIDKEELK